MVYFCQPEYCNSIGPKRTALREATSFTFTLTDKDCGLYLNWNFRKVYKIVDFNIYFLIFRKDSIWYLRKFL